MYKLFLEWAVTEVTSGEYRKSEAGCSDRQWDEVGEEDLENIRKGG